MSATMRAKLQIGSVFENHYGPDKTKTSETLRFHGVCKSGGYPEDGLDEDNTFARFSPSVDLGITIANPALWGKFAVGDKFYLDFTPAE